MDNKIVIPPNALVMLVGVAGAGKSSLAQKVFGKNAVVITRDECNKITSGVKDSFEICCSVIDYGLKAGRDSIIVSSDKCREILTGSEADQSRNKEVFELFYSLIDYGLQSKKQVIADATNINKKSRERLYEIAKKQGAPVYALVFNIPLETIEAQNKNRSRVVDSNVIKEMYEEMKIACNAIEDELPKENIIDIVKIISPED